MPYEIYHAGVQKLCNLRDNVWLMTQSSESSQNNSDMYLKNSRENWVFLLLNFVGPLFSLYAGTVSVFQHCKMLGSLMHTTVTFYI